MMPQIAGNYLPEEPQVHAGVSGLVSAEDNLCRLHERWAIGAFREC